MSKEEMKVEQQENAKEKPAIFNIFGLVSLIIGISSSVISFIMLLGMDSLRHLNITVLFVLILLLANITGIAFGVFGILSKKAKVKGIIGLALSVVALLMGIMMFGLMS